MASDAVSAERLLNAIGACAAKPADLQNPLPVGPRTLTFCDPLWESDIARSRRVEGISEEAAERRWKGQGESSLAMQAIAAHVDPSIVFQTREDAVHAWFVSDLKKTYQATRVAGKRAWPEFLAALQTNGLQLREPDCAALDLAAHVSVGSVDADGHLVVSPRILDGNFRTPLIDARSGKEVHLGDLCVVALRSAKCAQVRGTTASLNAKARALAIDMSAKPSKGVISAKVAAREAALEACGWSV